MLKTEIEMLKIDIEMLSIEVEMLGTAIKMLETEMGPRREMPVVDSFRKLDVKRGRQTLRPIRDKVTGSALDNHDLARSLARDPNSANLTTLAAKQVARST